VVLLVHSMSSGRRRVAALVEVLIAATGLAGHQLAGSVVPDACGRSWSVVATKLGLAVRPSRPCNPVNHRDRPIPSPGEGAGITEVDGVSACNRPGTGQGSRHGN
jgi:hypothetical protein